MSVFGVMFAGLANTQLMALGLRRSAPTAFTLVVGQAGTLSSLPEGGNTAASTNVSKMHTVTAKVSLNSVTRRASNKQETI